MSKSLFIQELARDGERWRLSIGEVQSTDELWHAIYPPGTLAPYGVTFEEEMVQYEPEVVGHFFLHGITPEAIEAMEPGFAQAFRDAEAPEPPEEGYPLTSVRVWLKSFIPGPRLRVPGYDCFLGDHRRFSSDIAAPARMHSEILITGLDTAMPSMNEEHRCGLTRQVDCDTGAPINSATAPTDGMRFYNFRYPGAEVYDWDQPHPPAANPGTVIVPLDAPVSVDYKGIAADPLVAVAPMIDFEIHLEIDMANGVLNVSGAVDDYPAFEGYALINEKHGPFTLFELDAGEHPLSIAGGATRPISASLSFGSYVALG
jgi:hypothetical protein